MYVAYGNTQISVAQLSVDGLSQVKTQVVYNTPSSIGTLEGSRMYKIKGVYYIFSTKPANGQYVLQSSSGPFGPYAIKELLLNIGSPIPSGGGFLIKAVWSRHRMERAVWAPINYRSGLSLIDR